MRQVTAITKALADENRLRLLMALTDGEVCFAKLTALIGVSASTASKHLSILYSSGLVEPRKEGRLLYYRLAKSSPIMPARRALSWVTAALADDPKISADRAWRHKQLHHGRSRDGP